jgi:predicted dehydrogenase
MYQAILNNSPVPVSAEEGTQVMQIIEAAINSSSERKAINL